MRIAVCTTLQDEYQQIEQSVRQFEKELPICIELIRCTNPEECFAAQQKNRFDILFICLSGAVGQELAIQAKKIDANCKIVWISDDPNFGVAAYRIHVCDFMVKPASGLRLNEALSRCFAADLDANEKPFFSPTPSSSARFPRCTRSLRWGINRKDSVG